MMVINAIWICDVFLRYSNRPADQCDHFSGARHVGYLGIGQHDLLYAELDIELLHIRQMLA
jgi:hypothetical protein